MQCQPVLFLMTEKRDVGLNDSKVKVSCITKVAVGLVWSDFIFITYFLVEIKSRATDDSL